MTAGVGAQEVRAIRAGGASAAAARSAWRGLGARRSATARRVPRVAGVRLVARAAVGELLLVVSGNASGNFGAFAMVDLMGYL